MVREATSEMLPQIHELPPLPPEGAATWLEPELFGLTLAASEDGPCSRIAGKDGLLRVAYAVCEGALRSLEMEAAYDTPVNRRVQERLQVEAAELSFDLGSP